MAVTAKKEGAIVALLANPTIDAAAAAAGVGSRTLFRWLQEDVFMARYRQARREAVGHATARLQAASVLAVDTLEAIMADSTAPASARVTAARSVLEIGLRAVELEDLSTRIEVLEGTRR